MDEGLGVWNGWLGLLGLVADSWLAVDPRVIFRALFTLELIFVRQKQVLQGVTLISRLGLSRDATFVSAPHRIILLKASLLWGEAKIILAVSHSVGNADSILLCGDQRLLHGRISRKLKRIAAGVG